ncbi:lipase family protein [Rhodococcus sp. G-MC3]|uniref:lipase family protein n=1 Tax=Rhodococcus sp. G-MC3 TaxID=3046209 RepID=UPI003FA6B46F
MTRIRTTAVATCSILVAAALIPAAVATAQPIADFYTPPAEFDPSPGSVVRAEPLPLLASFPGADGTWPGRAQRVMYTSRLQDDSPVAVTGTYIEASQPWQGDGERPTIIVAPGTVGQGDQCAPSRAFATGLNVATDPLSVSVNQELLASSVWIARGARVFVTDYIGLGTPGVHTYVNRVEEAHAVLDAARAANALSGTGSSTPTALWGYSQGGGAVAAAAELQQSYSPELNIKGTWAGAPPADLLQTLDQVDGTLIGGVIGFAVNGFVARRPELLEPFNARLTPEGKAAMAALSGSCIADVILDYPFLRTSTYTSDHQSLLANLRTIPEAAPVFDEQRIGTLTPTSPVLITSGRNDDTVPYAQARQLAVDWCAKGATVDFRTDELPPILPGAVLPNHYGPDVLDGYVNGSALDYITDRLDDIPVADGCTVD